MKCLFAVVFLVCANSLALGQLQSDPFDNFGDVPLAEFKDAVHRLIGAVENGGAPGYYGILNITFKKGTPTSARVEKIHAVQRVLSITKFPPERLAVYVKPDGNYTSVYSWVSAPNAVLPAAMSKERLVFMNHLPADLKGLVRQKQ